MSNLIKGLHDEIVRCKELKKLYDEIPTGLFGSTMIQKEIGVAERAIESGDIKAMLTSLNALRGCK